MTMDTNIRVKASRQHGGIYKQLTGLAVGDSHELFFLCACLGYRRGKATPLGRDGEDRFWSSTIKPEEWNCYYAMLLAEADMDFSQVQDDKKVIGRMEQYADAGMEILLAECLKDVVIRTGGELTIDTGAAKEVACDILQYLTDQVDE
jgi:hypothetical protein